MIRTKNNFVYDKTILRAWKNRFIGGGSIYLNKKFNLFKKLFICNSEDVHA
jgi:hypothetical protein